MHTPAISKVRLFTTAKPFFGKKGFALHKTVHAILLDSRRETRELATFTLANDIIAPK